MFFDIIEKRLKMAGINKVIVVGNVGGEPEVRQSKSGEPIVNLSIATSETWKDKQTGEKQERTEWHRVTLFGKLAEISSSYVKKGSKIYIEGSIRSDKWKDNYGQNRTSTYIVAQNMQLMDSRGSAPIADEQPAQPKFVEKVEEAVEDDIPF
jgi:single-strand DNA-binding protein